MAVGRITGPLLASNLLRDGVNLAVETNLLYLDVTTGRVGIKTASPQYDLDVNGTANVGVLRVSNTSTLGLLTVSKSLTSGTIASTLGPINITPAAGNNINLNSNVEVGGNLHATGNITADGNIVLGNQVTNDTLTIGAEIVSDLIPKTPNAFNIGSGTNNWLNGYFSNILAGNMELSGNTLTNRIPGNIDIIPQDGVLNVYGKVRIWEGTPLGTAPQTTNVLYVNEDGSDTNDGSAMDASRACRTISGATKSPLYRPGTSIKVSPGHYIENNPIEMKPYTSVIGSDLRTTIVESANKTQDLFHVRSGCYIAQLMMFNGRSGRFPGDGYKPNTNRGAYATSFPNTEVIDLFQSPYIQNCTNQSGPWLYDGTMFVPNQTVQVPEAVGFADYAPGDSTITVTLTTGTLTVGQAVNGGPPDIGFYNARTLLLSNKSFIAEQVVAFVNQTYGGPFQYNQAKCVRDTGLIVDSLGLDLIYGGTSQSVFSGIQYWAQDGYTGQITSEVSQTVQAFNYISSIAQEVVRNITVATPYQNTVTQVINSNPGAIGDAARINTLMSTITNIISNGTVGITDLIVSNGEVTTSTTTQYAYTLLQANKSFLEAEATAYINSTFGGFQYDQVKCKRDVGYIVDSVSFDLLRGGNRQSIQSGVCYYGFSSTVSQIPNERVQTTMAYNYMKSVIEAVVQSQQLTSFYQSEISQVLDNNNAGSAAAATTIGNNIDIITRLISVGPAAAPALIPIGLTETADTGLLNAYTLLKDNEAFIKAEVTAYVNSLPNFVYNQDKCARDVGIILENVSYDALFGGNQKSVESGLSYYSGVTSVIGGQEVQTTGAIDHISTLANAIIRNQAAPNLLGSTATHAQVINYALTGGGIAQTALENGFGVINNIILNGPSAAPTSIAGSAPDPYYMSAEVLLQANRTFIQDEIVTFVNTSFLNFPFNTSKCARDTGLVVDALAFDLLYPTITDSQSNFTGLQYWNQGSYTGQIGAEISTTTNAISYLSSLAQKIVINDTSGPRYQSALVQDTTIASGTITDVNAVQTNFNLILDIINNGTYGVTDKIVPNGLASTVPGTVNAYTLLFANLAYLKAEVIAYVESTKTSGFVYDQVKCSRDVGYIVDSVAFDLLHGGTRQSVQAGVTYYGFNGSSTAIPNEITETVGAYTYLKDVVAAVVTATPISRSPGNTVTQTINLPPSTTGQAALLGMKVDKIINIIQNGPSVASALLPISQIADTSEDVAKAFDLLEANRDFIAKEIVAYINAQYNGSKFSYNKAKCSRDTGLIVDSIITDILFPDNGYTQSNFAGLQYWNQNGYTGQIGRELSTTTAAINYISGLSQQIVTLDTSGTRYSTGTQVTNLPTATITQAGRVSTDFSVITNILQNGTTAVTDAVVSPGQTSLNSDAVNAFNLLQANKAYLQAEAVAFVESSKTVGFTYNSAKCYRDVGYMVDCVSFDILYGGNRQATQAGVYYYGFSNTASAIPTESIQVTAAYERLRSILPLIITNQQVGASTGNSQLQVTNLTPATSAQSVSIQSMVDLIVNIINNGPSAAQAEVPVSLNQTVDQDAKNAAAILLANRDFIRAELIAYADQTFTTGYTYNKTKCARDTGLIVDGLVTDLAWGANGYTQSNFVGLQYWNQNGYTGLINQELTTTTAALSYISTIAQQLVTNTIIQTPYQSTVTQIFNLPAATISEATSVQSEFGDVLTILTNGTAGVTDLIVSNGTTPASVNAQKAFNILQANKGFLQAETIAFVEATKDQGFYYNEPKCYRDTGLIVDAIAQDLLFNGTSQSTFAGIQYWNQSGYVGAIASELTTTTNAVSYVKDLAKKVILNSTGGTRYQSTITQVTNLSAGNAQAANTVGVDFDVILDILENGVVSVTDKIEPNGLIASLDTYYNNAYALLQANKAYIKAEAVAYVESTKTAGFTYDGVKCKRDVGYMIDSVCIDLLYGGNRQAIQSGTYYYGYSGSSSAIPGESVQVSAAYNYIKSILSDIITGVALPSTYQSAVSQVLSSNHGNSSVVTTAQGLVDTITNIINNGPGVASTATPIGLTVSNDANTINGATLLEANRAFIQAEVIAYINTTYPAGFQYDQAKCYRDTGYLIDSISYDILYGGNRQAIMSGVYYYGFSGSASAIPGEQTQTTLAYTRMREIVADIITNTPLQVTAGNDVAQQFTSTPAAVETADALHGMIDKIIDIISNGPGVADTPSPIGLVQNTDDNIQRAMTLLQLNREFIKAEIIAYVDKAYGNNYFFNYNQEKCHRDLGLIVDAFSQDLLLTGNKKTIEAALTYWTGGVNVVYNEIPQFNAAFEYMKMILPNILTNTTFNQLSTTRQVTNTFYSGGENAVIPLDRLINVFTEIVAKGPAASPTPYQGSGVFATFDSSVDNISRASTVLEVEKIYHNQYRVTLSQPVRSLGTSAILYFGQTAVYPTLDKDVPAEWAQRKIDPFGSCGGALIDGAVISDRSPIQSFVFDAFTQLNQGGIGIHITNNGYAQLVSVFTIFCGTSVIVENGGICSITNSNANFGDYCLVAKGYGKRSFFGEVYNPPVLPYYPNGFYPQSQQVEIYVPDPDYRPHIGLIMEVIPPETYTNNQGLPGFLSAQLNTSTLTTGSITISGIDTTGIVIGQGVYARDQFGSYTDLSGNKYIAPGTIVTDVNFKSITLSNSINAGGGDVTNSTFFTLYVSGNAYYTILGSTPAPDPLTEGVSFISPSVNSTGNDNTIEEVQAINYINSLTNQIINNKLVDALQTTATQFTNIALTGGSQSSVRIGQLFGSLTDIITGGLEQAPAIEKTGIVSPGAASAAALLKANKSFLQAEVLEYINSQYFVYDHKTCRRDLGYILDGFGYDAVFGSNYQAIKCGNAYLRAQSAYVLNHEKPETTDAVGKLSAITVQLAGINTVTSAISQINLDGIAIQNIINQGAAGQPAYTLPNPSGFDNGLASAKTLITSNIDFIKEELIGWINATYPTYTYDQTKCKRDIGLVLDGVEADMLLGTNYRAVKSGLAYYRGNAEAVLLNEKSQTIAAFNFVRDYCLALNSVAASSTATQTVISDFATINTILLNGGVAPTVTYSLPSNIDTGYASASQLITANRAFIQAEVEAYVYTTYTGSGFTYDRTKCSRDVGVLVDAIVYDITYGGNSMSVDAALQYFNSANNNVSFIPNETVQTVSAINYINTLLQKVIINASPTTSYQSGVSQYKNTNLTLGANASGELANLVTEMANIVGSGPSAAPLVTGPDTSWVNTSIQAAATAINTDKGAAASEAITFIDQNFTVFSYNQDKCRRDTEYVIWSMMYDLTYGGNWQTVDAALNYYKGSVSLIPNEITQTVGAYEYLAYLMKRVAVNLPPAQTYQSTFTQFENQLLIQGDNANTLIDQFTTIITTIIGNGPTAAPAIVYPSITGYSSTLQNVYNIIQTQKTNLVNQTITYIDNKYNGFEYNQAICKRDVGYIVDAISADLLSGGNYNTVLSGQSYFARNGTHHYVTLEDNVADATLFPDKALVNFYQRSYMSASGYLFEYVGAGSNYGALPQVGRADPIQEREVIQLNNGKVFFTSTDQNGDFRIGPGLVISQATGVLSGRTFTKSLFANLTPFILAIAL